VSSSIAKIPTLSARLRSHLIFNREHASKSAEQQQETLQKLGVVHDETVKAGGIAASILEYLVPRKSGQHNRAEEIRSLQAELSKTIWRTGTSEDSSKPHSIILSQAECERIQSVFLVYLQYDSMIDRESRIAVAHESTFQWVFRSSKDPCNNSRMPRWSSLQEWLKSNHQVYWITGKAGSGKSTLMKFLCSPAEDSQEEVVQETSRDGVRQKRCRCDPYLEEWAGPSKLIVASFYFWNSGMEAQMTIEGLLRTLLYQVVAQRPDIIPAIAPKEWESLCLFSCLTGPGTAEAATVHIDMLFRAIQVLSKDSKICFFIDGLDEFAHNHDDLISLIKNLIVYHDHLKVCVASRPWNIFQIEFGQKPNLRLEDLTFDDIRKFVESKFHADKEFEGLRRRYSTFANQLMDNIVTKSSGVFLWVDLVVASLLAGMRLGDRIQDFQRRLDELPPDLEDLYEKILQSLDPFYLPHAAQYFSLVEAAEVPLTILQFSFADEEPVEAAIKMRHASLTDEDISLRVDAMTRRLNSRCKGFLEIDRATQNLAPTSKRHPSQLTVQYLHRTVRDYIKSPKSKLFLQSTSDPYFDPSFHLCVAYLMYMKSGYGNEDGVRFVDQEDNEEGLSFSNVSYCLRQAARVDRVNEGATLELLDELKHIIYRSNYRLCREQLGADSCAITDLDLLTISLSGKDIEKNRANAASDDAFLSCAIMHGVVLYARARTEWGGLIRRPSRENPEERWPLLLDALSVDVPDPKMVECLLDLGADPNFKISKTDPQTPWIVALTKGTLLYTIQNKINNPTEYLVAEDKWKQTLRLMFSRGADRTKRPDSLLTPLSRKFLQELRDEVKSKEQSPAGLTSWLRAWNLA
jgi:hypothetical protein